MFLYGGLIGFQQWFSSRVVWWSGEHHCGLFGFELDSCLASACGEACKCPPGRLWFPDLPPDRIPQCTAGILPATDRSQAKERPSPGALCQLALPGQGEQHHISLYCAKCCAQVSMYTLSKTCWSVSPIYVYEFYYKWTVVELGSFAVLGSFGNNISFYSKGALNVQALAQIPARLFLFSAKLEATLWSAHFIVLDGFLYKVNFSIQNGLSISSFTYPDMPLITYRVKRMKITFCDI